MDRHGAATVLLLLLCAVWTTVEARDEFRLPTELQTHAFYYCWYGTPDVDGAYKHWNHEVLPHWTEAVSRQHPIGKRFRPPDELHSPFYPLGGPYSSSDAAAVRRQMRQLGGAGVGVVVASWWGPAWRKGSTDTQGVSTDAVLPLLLRAAEAEGVRVALHLEPYRGRTAASAREDLLYLMAVVGHSPALLRVGPRRLPVYYVYDSYHIPPQDWAKVLTPGGPLSLRGSAADGVFLALWLQPGDGDAHVLPGGWDGFYTYFASEAVSYGANPANWPALAAWARRHRRAFVPSVGPGYNDERIRPWNGAATRRREGGRRYRRWWEAAAAARPWAVSITSFNEWGEGTQIEPAQVFAAAPSGGMPAYESYGEVAGRDEFLYLNITREWTAALSAAASQRQRHGRQRDSRAEL